MTERNTPLAIPEEESSMGLTESEFMEKAQMCLDWVQNVEIGSEDVTPTFIVLHKEVDLAAKKVGEEVHMNIYKLATNEFNTHDGKRKLFEAIATDHFNNRHFPVATFLVSEAWVSSVKLKDMPKDFVPTPPSDDPNRTEAIMIMGMAYPLQKNYMATIRIMRNADGIIGQVGEPVIAYDKMSLPLLMLFWSKISSLIRTTMG